LSGAGSFSGRAGDGTAYDLGRAADAHRDIEGRGTQGKLYLTPWQTVMPRKSDARSSINPLGLPE